jgi:hypothetical protein
MPIANGAKGRPAVFGIPGDRFLQARTFRSTPFSTRGPATVTGVTKDSTGASLAACTVTLFCTNNNAPQSSTVSDGSGNYTLTANVSGPYYVVAYKAGAPDVEGTTVNTLVGV